MAKQKVGDPNVNYADFYVLVVFSSGKCFLQVILF